MLAFLAAVVVLMCFSPGYVVAVIVGPIWIAALLAAYQVLVRRRGESEAILDE